MTTNGNKGDEIKNVDVHELSKLSGGSEVKISRHFLVNYSEIEVPEHSYFPYLKILVLQKTV